MGGTNYSYDNILQPHQKERIDIIIGKEKHNLGSGYNLNQSLTLSLTIPLFNGYSSTTNYKREKLNYELSQLSLKQEKNTLRQTIQTSYNDALAAYRQYLASEKALNAQQESFTYTQLRYEQNISNQVEFSNAKLLLANSAAELSRSKYDFIFKVKVLEFYKGNELSLSNE